MKRIYSIAAIAFAIVLFASCVKRDYVCTCSENHGGHISTYTYPLGNINNNTAQNECNGRQELLQKSGIASSCETNF